MSNFFKESSEKKSETALCSMLSGHLRLSSTLNFYTVALMGDVSGYRITKNLNA